MNRKLVRFLGGLVPVFALLGTCWADVIGGPIVNPTNGHGYYLLGPNTWTGSEAEAVSLGGHLVAISDEQEEVWVYDTFATFGDTNHYLWIGLTDEAIEGTFVWTTGETVTYTNWAGGEPNDGGSDYVYITSPAEPSDRASFWNDIDDSPTLNAVVEVLTLPTTTTSSSTTTLNPTSSSATSVTTTPVTSTTTTTISLATCSAPAALVAARIEVENSCGCARAKSHGAYVSCAKKLLKQLGREALLPKDCQKVAAGCAVKSTCGKPGAVTCCIPSKKGTKCKVKRNAARCEAKHGCTGVSTSCCDACGPGRCGE